MMNQDTLANKNNRPASKPLNSFATDVLDDLFPNIVREFNAHNSRGDVDFVSSVKSSLFLKSGYQLMIQTELTSITTKVNYASSALYFCPIDQEQAQPLVIMNRLGCAMNMNDAIYQAEKNLIGALGFTGEIEQPINEHEEMSPTVASEPDEDQELERLKCKIEKILVNSKMDWSELLQTLHVSDKSMTLENASQDFLKELLNMHSVLEQQLDWVEQG